MRFTEDMAKKKKKKKKKKKENKKNRVGNADTEFSRIITLTQIQDLVKLF